MAGIAAAVALALAVGIAAVVIRTQWRNIRSRQWFGVLAAASALGLIVLMVGLVTSRAIAATANLTTQQALPAEAGLGFVGAGLAAGLAAIGAGLGVGIAGAAAVGAIAEKPETFGRTLVIVGLAEGVAIYGLITAILRLGRI